MSEAWNATLAGVASFSVVGITLARPTIGLVLIGILLLLLLMLMRGPVVAAVLTVPAMWLAVELPGGIQAPDVLLTLAALLAIPAVVGRSAETPGVSGIRWAVVGYLSALVITTLIHPSTSGGLEILQRLMITIGAITVGIWLALEDRQRPALLAFVLIGVPIGVAAAWYSLTNNFEPAYPFGLHKNYAGALLAASFLVAWCAREPLGLRGWRLWLVLAPTAVGLVGCRSRGALLGLTIGLILWFFHTHSRDRRRLWWSAVVAAVGYGVFTARSVVDDLSGLATSRNSSVAIRTLVQQDTVETWLAQPWFGAGVRFWETRDATYPVFGRIPPVNAPTEALAEAGVVGGLTWLVMILAVLVVLWRRRGPWVTAALAVFAGRLVHILTDQGWNAGTSTLPWLLVGIALAASAPQSQASRAAAHDSRRP